MIINLPKLGPVRFADDMPQEQINARIAELAKKYDFKVPGPEFGVGETFTRGVRRGFQRMGSTLADVIPAMGASALGFDEYAAKQMQEAAETQRNIQQYNPAQFESYKQVEGPMSALKYGLETVGETTPDILGAMVTGGVGGALAKTGTTAAALTAEALAKRVALGQATGVYLGSYTQNAPEVFQSIYQETGKMEPAVSLLFGSVSAALDAVLPAQVLRGMSQPVKAGIVEKILERSGMEPSLIRKIAGTVPGTIAKEGLTEGAQEAINIAAEKFVSENPAIWNSKDFNRMIESSVRGAVAGGAFGTVGAAGERMQERGEEGRVARTAAEEAERQRIAALPPEPEPPAAPGAPTSYATAVQEVERLKREPQTPEVKARIAELEAYKTQTVMDSLTAAREPVSKESIALRKQMMDQQAMQGTFRETEGLPTREIPAEPAALAEKEVPTILDASTLDRTGLPKQSGFYKQLLGKDLTNLEDLDAITQIIDKAKTNPRLSPSTKEALGNLRWQAMQIYGEQGEMFSPRAGNVLEPIETPELKVTPAAKKIAQVTQNQDMTDPAVVEAVRESLIDYANEPTRTAEAIHEVSDFLDTLPPAYPEPTDVIKSTEPVTPANEPSPPVVSERGEVPAGGTQAPFDFGMGPAATNVEQPIAGETVQPAALEETVAPEIRKAIDLLEAIDKGGVPLSPVKLNNVARDIGLDVSKSAKPEVTIGRIRAAVERAELERSQKVAMQQAAPTVTEAPSAQPTNLPAVIGAAAPVRAEQPAPSVPFPVPPAATPMPQAQATAQAAGVPAVTEQPAPAPSAPAQLEGKKPSTALTTETTDIIEGQVRVIDDETIAPLVAQLPAPEQQQLASHYGEEVGSPEFLAKVRDDISKFAVKGAQAVNKAIREIIRALHNAVLAAAIIFNPAYTSPGYVLAVPQNVTTTEQVLAKVPDSVRERMSPGAQQAYANIMPAFGAELKKNNKLFIITDKPNARVFVFDSNGQPILDKKVLLGLQVGDYYKGDPEKIKANRITSGGLYTMGLRDAKRGITEWGGDEYATAHDYDFGKVFVLDKALNGTSSVTLFHSVYTKLPDAKRRLAALQKEGPEDSRYSYGCINVDKATYKYLLDNYQDRMNGAKLFIVPDNPDTTMEFMRGKAVTAGDLVRQYVPEVTKEVTKTVPGTPSATTEKTQMAARKEEGIEETRKPGLYRDVVKSGEGMSRDAVQKIADYVMAHWKNAPETKVIEDITKLPEKLYQQMVRDNAFDAPGVYDPNTKIVYLIAENIPNETEAKLTIAHEALGHFGLQSILGSSYGKVMDDIYNGNTKVRAAAQEKIDGGLPKHTAIEEVLAEMAEAGVYNNAIQRAFNAIRQFLRRLGVPMNKVTDTEIRELLANSQRFVVAAGPAREGITAFRGKDAMYRRRAKKEFDDISNSIIDLPPFANDIKEGALDALSRVPDSLRSAALGFLTMPQINQLYGKDLPSLDSLITTLEKRSTSLMNRREYVSKHIKDWYKIANEHKKDLPRFFDIANKTTLDQIDVLDPAQASNPLTKQFKQLPQGLQDVYAGMRKDYDDFSKEFLDSMTANLSGSAASKMRAMFESQRLKVYLPLRRFGDYWLTYKDKSGERVSAAFTSPRQRDLAIADAKKAGATDFKSHARLSQISYRTTPPTGFMGSVVAEMTKGKVDPAVIDNVYQAYMALFPAESLRQQFRKREGTLGFEKDVFQTYADTASKMVSQLSNMEHSEAIENAVAGIRKEASETPTTEIRDVVDNLQKQLDFVRNPVNSSLTAKASYFSYMMFIAGNVSSAVVNLSQLPIVVYPLLGGKYGFDNAASAMQRATSMYYKGGKDTNSEFMPDHTFGTNAKGEYKQLYDVAVERAAIRRSTGYELTEARRTSVEDYTGRRAKVEHALGWVFQNSERANREITLIAAFDLARKNGKSVDAAIEEALQIVNDAHGASLAEIGPRFFQQGIGKVAFTFKRFAQSQIYLLSRLFHESMRGADAKTKSIARR